MTQQPSNTPIPPQITTAAQAFRGEILARLNDERGVHAETAVATAARMAGMFMFRSFNLDLGKPPIAPGTAVLSDQANEAGPGMLQLLAGVAGGLGLKIDTGRLGAPTPKDNEPQLTTLATEEKFEPAFEALRRAHGLNDVEAAQACAIAAVLLVRDTQQVLDINIGFGLALFGVVEGSKSAPVPRSKP